MRALIAICTSIFSCGALLAQDNTTTFVFPKIVCSTDTIRLWATQYYVHSFKSSGSVPFLDKDQRPTGLFADTCNFCKASREGTAFITDSTGRIHVLTYHSTHSKAQVNCKPCQEFKNSTIDTKRTGSALWKRSSGFGEGVRGYRLIPFRTIAVDPSRIPYGSVIYIPDARGKTVRVSDSLSIVHDGYFFAGDTGHAIRENHVDLFSGAMIANPFPGFIKSRKDKTVLAYFVKDQSIINELERQHKK